MDRNGIVSYLNLLHAMGADAELLQLMRTLSAQENIAEDEWARPLIVNPGYCRS